MVRRLSHSPPSGAVREPLRAPPSPAPRGDDGADAAAARPGTAERAEKEKEPQKEKDGAEESDAGGGGGSGVEDGKAVPPVWVAPYGVGLCEPPLWVPSLLCRASGSRAIRVVPVNTGYFLLEIQRCDVFPTICSAPPPSLSVGDMAPVLPPYPQGDAEKGGTTNPGKEDDGRAGRGTAVPEGVLDNGRVRKRRAPVLPIPEVCEPTGCPTG